MRKKTTIFSFFILHLNNFSPTPCHINFRILTQYITWKTLSKINWSTKRWKRSLTQPISIKTFNYLLESSRSDITYSSDKLDSVHFRNSWENRLKIWWGRVQKAKPVWQISSFIQVALDRRDTINCMQIYTQQNYIVGSVQFNQPNEIFKKKMDFIGEFVDVLICCVLWTLRWLSGLEQLQS